MEWGQSSSTWNDPEAKKLPETVKEMQENGSVNGATSGSGRKRLVIVGLGMVGIAFM